MSIGDHKHLIFGLIPFVFYALATNVSAQGSCAPPPSGLVSWWPADGDARDITRTNNGTLAGGATFAPGEVGSAFGFNGNGSYVQIADSPSLSFTNDFTIELWYQDTGLGSGVHGGLVAKRPPFGACNYGLTIVGGTPGSLLVYYEDSSSGSYAILTYSGLPPAGSFHHLAATFHQALSNEIQLTAYIDSVSVQTTNLPGNLANTINNVPVVIGCSNPSGGEWFKGNIDEVSIYNRSLSASEVAAIYSAGSAGKCLSAYPPLISSQPTNVTIFAGQNAGFSASAGGAPPLIYQWMFHGAAITGATGSSLSLTNVQSGQAGNYTVVITNTFGSVTSSNASLTVNVAPPCDPAPAGLVDWWRAEGDATDSVGTLNGTLVNGTGFAPGEVGQAFSFDGHQNMVTNGVGGLMQITNSYTFEFWAWPTASRASTTETTSGIAGISNQRYAIFPHYGPASVVGAGVSVGTNGVSVFEHGNTYLPSLLVYDAPIVGWTHIAVVYSNQQPSLYLNGVLVKTGLTSINPSFPGTDLGEEGYGYGYYAGLLDEVSIYSRALTAAEIQAIYNAGSAGKCAPAVAPAIYLQPANQAVFVGQNATFRVGASGSHPLNYQWVFQGAAVPGATGSSLNLTNVQSGEAGNYAVVITNAFGSVISSNASLTVNVPPPCDPAPAGLVSWWPAEGDARDVVGANSGSTLGGVTFGLGEVGQSFIFNGTSSYVEIPDSPSLSFTSDFTIEFWYKDNGIAVGSHSELFAKRPLSGPCNYGISMMGGSPASMLVYFLDPNYGSYQVLSYQGLPPAGGFHHLAATFHQAPSDQIQLSAYIDGQLVQTGVVPGNLTRTTNNVPVDIGRANANGDYFKGQIDEASIYGRLLSASEIAAIYQAGSAGKCSTPIPASIYQQPADQTAIIGQTATFTVGGAGTWPLSYQWAYNGASVAGATNSSLVLTNVQMSRAGLYSVVVTNAYGSATSSNAVLAVIFPPATVSISLTSGTAGALVTVPVLIAANGNENALGFSVNFDPTLLTNAGVSLGAGASGASLVFNTNLAGKVGVGVALPSGTTFAAGTQEVADLSFISTISQTNFSTGLSFGDQPTKRVLADVTANTLPVNFVGGQVSLTRSAFEADVAPRPNGDGEVTVADWAQVGRFVAALDSPTNASEFQRADCAPRATLGDGLLTVSDWVQAGRYAAGLDPLTLAGGPTGPSTNLNNAVTRLVRPKGGQQRVITVQGPVLFDGQTGTITINLQAQGDENAVGLSLAFDPTVLTYAGAGYGSDATGAAGMVINANHATNGQVGIILALPSDVSFSPGTRQILTVSFKAATAASINSALAFADLPVPREVADTNAVPLVTTYDNGTVSVNPLPSLAISHTSQSISLSWPLWATNYVLQGAASSSLPTATWTNAPVAPVMTNNALSVILPIDHTPHFYRLQHQ